MPDITNVGSQPFKATANSRAVTIFTRVPLVSLTVVLTLIAIRYPTNPAQAASTAGIVLTSPGAITVARVGFAGFPLAFAVFFLSCLFSQQTILSGLRTELTLLGIVIGIRVLGMALAHSGDTAKLLVPELVMAAFCIFAMRVEIYRQKREQVALSC